MSSADRRINAVVFVHAAGLNAGMWDPVATELAAAGWSGPLLAVDLPGHGSRRNEPYSWTRAVDTVVAAVATIADDAESGGCLLVGASIGGHVALATAAQSSQVQAVACLGATAHLSDPRLRSFHRRQALVTRRLPQLLLDTGALLQARASLGRTAARSVHRRGLPVASTSVALLRDLAESPDTVMAASAQDVPVLVVNGEKDRFATDGLPRFRTRHRVVAEVVLPGIGHLGPARRCASHLARWTNSLPPGR